MEGGELNYLERIAEAELRLTMREQAEAIGFMLSPYQTMEDARSYTEGVADSMRLNIVSDEQLYGRVPVQIEARNGNQERAINFDVPTFVKLCDDLVEGYKVTPREVAGLYIGAGIALRLLEERIGMHPGRIERLWDIMKNPVAIDTAIRASGNLDDGQKDVLLNAMMHMDREDSIAHINALRFGIGVLFMQSEEPLSFESGQEIETSYENRLTEQFLQGLTSAVSSKPAYEALLRSWGRSQFTIDRTFAEGLPEIGLAACFPMRISELRTVLSVTHDD
jgi:hypothetical protein